MDNFEFNKIMAAVLIALIVGAVGAVLSDRIVAPQMLDKNVYEVAILEPSAGVAEEAPKELAPIAPLLAAANVENGEKIAKKACAQCHTFAQGQPHRIGPNLWQIVGHKMGAREGFAYSKGYQGRTEPWTYENLNKLLYKPRDYIPGTKMSFAGLPKAEDRADVIAYLRSLSGTPQPLP